uniref:Uncharacterized protein n=1 Tax=Avena sativa TaxID=4498 RepID=A0ACD5V2S9_AVESA
MGAALSSAAAVYSAVRATKNYARRWFMTQQDAAAAVDWSSLPEDLLLTVVAALDIRSRDRCSAVCSSWRDACTTVRPGILALKRAPCLLYACHEYGPSDAALYCPSTDTTFRVPFFPGGPHDKRGFVFSCNGWVFAANEAGDPYLFNPITGVQALLPPLKTIMCRDEDFYDDEGKRVYEPSVEEGIPTRQVQWARHSEYVRAAISSSSAAAEVTVVIVRLPDFMVSFARPGDKRWTLLPKDIRYIDDVLYNHKDGLFYILHSRGAIYTLDLSGPSPSMATIMDHVTSKGIQRYLTFTPSGELLQVWRLGDQRVVPLKNHLTRQDVQRLALQDCIEFADEDGSGEPILESNYNEEDYCMRDEEADIDDNHDWDNTTEVIVFKVDIDRKKLVELRDIGGHALFVGFNAAVCLPAKDLSPLEQNCVYLTDDSCLTGPQLRKDLRIWNMKKRSMQKLADAWPNVHSWLHIPAPIWITPRF